MNKLKYIAFAALLAAASVGCADRWLEEVKPKDGSLTPSIIFESEGGVTNAVTGLYSMIRDYAPSYTESNGGRHNTYGFRLQSFVFDAMGNDYIIYAPYGWFGADGTWNAPGFNKTGTRSSDHWVTLFKYINNANSLIKGVNESSALSETFKKQTVAEAKVIRAWAYFHLSRIYQNTYATSKNEPCVPIYTEPANAEETGKPRSTVEKVYEQIMEDLADEVLADMPTTKAQPYRLNRDGGYAIRAQVKLQMENWAGAAADALLAIGNNASKYPLMDKDTYQSGFNTLSKEVLWGSNIVSTQGKGITSFAAFAAGDYYSFPYFCAYINEDFKALFSATDVRGELIVDNPGAIATKPNTKLISNKFMSKFDFEMDDYLIRASEILLIQAEGLARSNNESQAHDLLYYLQKQRDPSAVKSSNTGVALIDEILVERRKELYGEIGVEYFDLYRFNKPLVRTGNQEATSLFTVPGGGANWKFQIPQQEETSNPNIGPNNPVRITPKA